MTVEHTGSARSARAEYAVAVLRRLYPAPLRIGAEDEAGPGDPVRARFLLLPSPRRVRLVVPAGHRLASARAVDRQLTGSRPRTRAARLLLTLAVRSGGADRLARGTLVVSGPADADSVEQVLAEALGCDHVLVALPVSPPRANRKPVLQLTDDEGAALAFVKVGHDTLTRRLVLQEGHSLEAVAASGLTGVRAPRVLARQAWNDDLELLVLEPLPLPRSRLTGAAARATFLRLVLEIAGIAKQADVPWASSPYRARLADELAACGPRATPLLAHLTALDALAPQLTLGAWHGDLNPGNVVLLEPTSMVWDWERFERGVPLGFDVLHHDLHSAVTVAGVPAAVAARQLLTGAAAALEPLHIAPTAAAATSRLYLLALAARYLHDQQSEAGAELGDIESWLLPALDAPALS